MRQFVAAAKIMMFQAQQRGLRAGLTGEEAVALAVAEKALDNLGRILS